MICTDSGGTRAAQMQVSTPLWPRASRAAARCRLKPPVRRRESQRRFRLFEQAIRSICAMIAPDRYISKVGR